MSTIKKKAPRYPYGRRGFAGMSIEARTKIARKGGKTLSRDRAHMAEIGSVGGANSVRNGRSRAKL